MELFSERYGYSKPKEKFIRESMPLRIQTIICNCFEEFGDKESQKFFSTNYYWDVNEYIWLHFLGERKTKQKSMVANTIVTVIGNNTFPWYEKLNLVEAAIKFLKKSCEEKNVVDNLISKLNSDFTRFSYAYQIVNYEIIEITSKVEVEAIETAINNSDKSVQVHLSKALDLYAQMPQSDTRNSIKESMSAVEYFCRKETGESTLGKALNKWESQGIVIPNFLNEAFQKLYVYTNQPDTGIRHALMDDNAVPKKAEALFMLVICSAFINYLRNKLG